ncbi:DUF6485 family protein [Thomasclavelia spiroformis]|uniref:DUF6485 family protein n=1 Tax=Thomasclavelia spiroformis TaxID=29348 RepID=UPI00349F23DE
MKCLLHPSKHDKGCTPCIVKNLKVNEILSFFFNKIDNRELRESNCFKDFAKLVL